MVISSSQEDTSETSHVPQAKPWGRTKCEQSPCVQEAYTSLSRQMNKVQN